MALNWPQTTGVNLVGEYQVSGHLLPVSTTNADVNLKYVASSITAVAAGNITFYDGSGNTRVVAVAAGTRIVGKFIKFKNAGAVVVELTNIPAHLYTPPDFSDLA